MDPLSLGLILANSIVVLATKVWDATPVGDQHTGAADIAASAHKAAEFLHAAQDRILSLVQHPASDPVAHQESHQ